MIEISLHPDLPTDTLLDIDSLADLAAKVFILTGNPAENSFSLRITRDDEIRQLNREYLDKDTPTDVLSFPVRFDDPETGAPYLGDIVISLPTAARQAETAGHQTFEEIKLLLIHGMLHLLGYDHTTPEEKAEMWMLQDKILKQLGIQVKPTES